MPPAGVVGPPAHPRVAGARDAEPRPRPSIVREFKRAWEAKDIGALIGLLDPDATAIGDGGGLAAAALLPIRGAERVARAAARDRGTRCRPGARWSARSTVSPASSSTDDGVTVTVLAFDVAGDRIKHIWSVRNPDKLRPWDPPQNTS